MTDQNSNRNGQADDDERRQRERTLEEARNRGFETKPSRDEPGCELGELDRSLENHSYPTTTAELIDAYGDREVQSQGGWMSIEDVLAPVGGETFDSADEARNRIQEELRRD